MMRLLAEELGIPVSAGTEPSMLLACMKAGSWSMLLSSKAGHKHLKPISMADQHAVIAGQLSGLRA